MARYRVPIVLILCVTLVLFVLEAGYLSFWLLMSITVLFVACAVWVNIASRRLTFEYADITPDPMVGCASGLKIIIRPSGRIRIGCRVRVRLRISNAYTEQDAEYTAIVSAGGRGDTTVRFDYTPLSCGVLRFEVTELACYDPFLFLCRRVRTADAPVCPTVFVRPKIYAVHPSVLGGGGKGGTSPVYFKTCAGTEPPDVFDYRGFQSGDSAKSISAKLSSRYDELIVKQYSKPHTVCPAVVFTASDSASPAALNAIAEVVASVAQGAVDATGGVRLIYFGCGDWDVSGGFVSDGDAICSELASFCSARRSGTEPDILGIADAKISSALIYVSDMISEGTLARLLDADICTRIFIVGSCPSGAVSVTPDMVEERLGGAYEAKS